MGRKKRVHKHLPHNFDEVPSNVAKGKGIEKKKKDAPKKKHHN
jgi:hypothetical protein